MADNELLTVQNMIYEIRGQKVMLDQDLAELYEVPTYRLNEAVKRNIKRFPEDFMFQLTEDEWKKYLRSQFAISKNNQGGRRYTPYVFTEQGVSMLSSVINSEHAIEVNISIMRAFVKLRHFVHSQQGTNNGDGGRSIEYVNEQIVELRKLLMLHIESNDCKFSEHDKAIRHIVQALNNLIEHPPKTKTIGFRPYDENPKI